MIVRLAAFVVFALAAAASAGPDAWVDPAPKPAPAVDGAPHLVFEAEFVVGSGGGYSIAFDASGARMATGGTHGDVVIWDAATMTPTARWRPYGNAVESLALSPDGKLLVTGALPASCDAPGAVMLWDVDRREVLARFEGGSATAFAPDGSWFAYRSAGAIVLVDVKSLKEIRRFDAGGVERIAVSRDGKRIAVGGTGRARAYDVEGKLLAETALEEGEPVHGVGFLADGTLVAASRKGSVRIGAVAAKVPPAVGSLAVSPDGSRIAVGEMSGKIHVLDVAGREVRALQGPAKWIGSIAFRPKSDDLAWIPDGAAVCVARGDDVATYSGNESEIRSVAFTRDGAFVAASGNETVFFDFAAKTARVDAAAGFVATGSDASTILRADRDGVRAFAPRDGAVVATFAPRPIDDDRIVEGLWASPGRKLALASGWLGTRLAADGWFKPFGDFGRVFDGAWSADGLEFYGAILFARMCGNDPRAPNVVLFARFDRLGRLERKIPIKADAESLDLAPSGKVVALATADAVQFRDAATGDLVESIPVKTRFWRFVADDAAVVATGSGLSLWRRGVEKLSPLVEGPASGFVAPSRERLALVMGGRVFVYRLAR